MPYNPIGNVFANTGEDFVDEFVSSIVYAETNNVMKDIKEKLNLSQDSYLDEAIEGALMTLQFGLMNSTIMLVTEYAIVKSSAILLGLVAFIKGRAIVHKVRKYSSDIMNEIGSKGRMVGKFLGHGTKVLIGTQEETIAIAKMTNDTANNIISALGQERQNQIHLQNGKVQRVDNQKSNLYGIRNTSRSKDMEMFYHKFKTGTWQKTPQDKKLYFNCTGQDDIKVPWNLDYVNRINQYSDFTKTAEGNVYSNAKATLDMIILAGARVGA